MKNARISKSASGVVVSGIAGKSVHLASGIAPERVCECGKTRFADTPAPSEAWSKIQFAH